jgi:hypothetical protein
MAGDKRRSLPSETELVRWLCYVGFFVCALALVTSLSAGSGWLGPFAGVVIFGVPALKMYVLETVRIQSEKGQAKWARENPPGHSKHEDWDLQNPGGDPAQPPKGIR